MAAIELQSTPLYSDANLVAYYRLEGNSNDSKGSNNGTDTSITYNSGNGVFGQGAGLNGTSSKIVLSAFNQADNASFTISCWFNFTGTTLDRPLVGLGSNYYFSRYSTTKLSFSRWGANDIGATVPTMSEGTWYHGVVTYNGAGWGNAANWKFYLNGVNYAAGSFSGGAALLPTSGAGAIGYDVGGGGHVYYNGKIDDVAILNRDLTPTEISNLYNGTWPTTARRLALLGVG